VVVSNGVVGAWAFGAEWQPRLRTRWLWVLTAVAQVAIFVQVGLGVAVQNVDEIEPPQMHDFYGFIAIITVAIVYAYRVQLRDRLYLLYGFGGLFLMGLGIRAMVLHS
jgi:hypothetical protein